MIPMKQPTRKKNKNSSKIQSLDVFEAEDEGIIECDIDTGKVLSTFSFGMSAVASDDKTSAAQEPVTEKKYELPSTLNQTFSSAPRGLTPPINGENYTVKRSYAMRPSTVRKLNALKTEHPDVNIL